MKRLAALLVLSIAAGCQSRPATEASDAPVASVAPDRSLARALSAHAWSRTDPDAAKGSLMIFNPDGTLLMDSCFETYRLSQWVMVTDSVALWDEDGAKIPAAVLAVDDEQLVLRLALRSGDVEQHFRVATAPYTCPDMPK